MSVTTHKIKAKSHILTLLGNELIGSDSLAIFELVKNAYDADAENVKITFFDLNTPNQKIIIEDDGHGMNSTVIQDVWLTIGTDFKRGNNRKESKVFERVSFGNKGVGRLAVHKLAKEIILESQVSNDLFSNRLKIDWKTLIESKEFIQELEVDVESVYEKIFEKGHGTRIILSKLTTTNWSKKSLKDLVRKIDNIKNPFRVVDNFEVKVNCNDWHQEWINEVKSSVEIIDDSLYQFNFEIDFWKKEGSEKLEVNDLAKFIWSYSFNPPIQTLIESNNLPLNLFEQIDEKVNKNFLHIGELYKDIDGENDFNMYLRNKDILEVGKVVGKFHVFNQSPELMNRKYGGQVNAVKAFIKENCGVKIFRDNIRVYNYGESFDDWLSLDLDKIQKTGDHFGKKVTIGYVELSLKQSNEGLVEKTNREGFTDNQVFKKFQLLIKHIFSIFEKTSEKDKEKIEEYIEQAKPIKKVGFGDTITELQKKIEQKNLTRELEPLIKRVDKDYTEMRDIMVNSGMIGLNLGVAFHEVDRDLRTISTVLDSGKFEIEDIRNRIKNLMQVLDNLSPLLRQNKSVTTSAFKIVERAKQININRFGFHRVILSSPLLSKENEDFTFKGPSSLLTSAISNLIDNGIYWTRAKRDLKIEEDYKPAIFIGTDFNTFDGPAIIIADNGVGFTAEPEYLTQPFKSNKEGGMGLGLYFTDLVMNMMGGKLIFPDAADLEIPKAYNGACLALVFPKK